MGSGARFATISNHTCIHIHRLALLHCFSAFAQKALTRKEESLFPLVAGTGPLSLEISELFPLGMW